MPFAPELLKVFEQPNDALAIVRAAFEHPACQDGRRMGAIAHWAVYYGDEDFALKALRRGYVELYGPTVAELWSPVFAAPRSPVQGHRARHWPLRPLAPDRQMGRFRAARGR